MNCGSRGGITRGSLCGGFRVNFRSRGGRSSFFNNGAFMTSNRGHIKTANGRYNDVLDYVRVESFATSYVVNSYELVDVNVSLYNIEKR